MKHSLLILAALVIASPVFSADKRPSKVSSTSPAAHPEERTGLEEIQGRIEAIDATSQSFQIRDAADKAVYLKLDSKSRIIDERNRPIALDNLAPKDKVVIYYDRTAGIARQVDRQPTAAEVILGK